MNTNKYHIPAQYGQPEYYTIDPVKYDEECWELDKGLSYE